MVLATMSRETYKVLVTGSNGQLGSELRELVGHASTNSATDVLTGCNRYEYVFADRATLDITDKTAINKFVINHNIKIIVNCASYTAVDKSESDFDAADAINHIAVANMATIAKQNNIKLMHVSTDYVFDGENYRPYVESDITNPQGVYGVTKLAGEQAIQAINPPNAIIIRTSWVYSYYGANFVKTMIKLGAARDSLGVIFDQVGSPTYAKDLAVAIVEIIDKKDMLSANGEGDNAVEIYNYSNEGVASWYDFAKEIMSIADIDCDINAIETIEYPTPAKRPHYSLLNKKKIKDTYSITIPYWKDSLKDCIKRLQKDL